LVYIQGKAILPQLKLSQHEFNFGTCKLNEKRDIILQISNTHPSLPVDIEFQKQAYIQCKPEHEVLQPR